MKYPFHYVGTFAVVGPEDTGENTDAIAASLEKNSVPH